MNLMMQISVKKAICILVFLGSVFCFSFGQENASPENPIDLVLVLDTSSGMSDSYRELQDYLTGPFLSEFLRIGDTFHLISFSNKARIEIARRVEGIGDVQTIVGRLFIMYPLDPYSDIGEALKYAENYVGLLSGARQKKVVFFSKGDSSSPDQTSGGVENLIAETAPRFSRLGAELRYIPVPLGGTPSSGRPTRQPTSAVAAQPPATPGSATTDPVVGPTQPGASAAAPLPVLPPPATTDPATRPDPPSAVPDSPAAASSVPLQPGESPEVPVIPPEGTASSEASPVAGGQRPESGTGSSGEAPALSGPDSGTPRSGRGNAELPVSIGGLPVPLFIGLAVLALLLLGLIIFLAVSRLHRSPNRAMAHAALPRRGEQETLATPVADKNEELFTNYAATQRRRTTATPWNKSPGKISLEQSQPEFYGDTLMLSLFVEDQNTFIGRRNVHTVKPGHTFTIGGGKSDFLIFLVPMPPHIAEIRFDGRNCTFFPRRPQLFPDLDSSAVPHCIGKTIRIMSEKNYELHIRMERYEDPLITLNRLLRSVDVPG